MCLLFVWSKDLTRATRARGRLGLLTHTQRQSQTPVQTASARSCFLRLHQHGWRRARRGARSWQMRACMILLVLPGSSQTHGLARSHRAAIACACPPLLVGCVSARWGFKKVLGWQLNLNHPKPTHFERIKGRQFLDRIQRQVCGWHATLPCALATDGS